MKSATSSDASSRSRASRSPHGTCENPGRSGPKRLVNSGVAVAESAPSVSPWKACAAESTRERPVAARPSLIAASTDSAPELVKIAFSTLAGARRRSSSASSAGSTSTPSCVEPGRSSSKASTRAARTRGLFRPTLNMPKPPSTSRYRLPSESQRYWPSARAQRRSKPIVRRSRTNCGLIVCAWRSSASAPRSSTSSVSQPTPGLSRHAYEHAAGDDERRTEQQPPPDQLASTQEQEREQDAPERLRRHERSHDAHATAVVGAEQSRVREPEEEPRGQEHTELVRIAPRPRGPARNDQVGRDRRHAGQEGDRRRDQRVDLGVLGDRAQDVVAHREEHRGDYREQDAEATKVRGAHPLARQRQPSRDDQARAHEQRRLQRLAEEDQSHHDSHERGGAHQH